LLTIVASSQHVWQLPSSAVAVLTSTTAWRQWLPRPKLLCSQTIMAIHQRLSLAGSGQSRDPDSRLAPRVVTRRCYHQDSTDRRTRWPASVAGLVATFARLQYRRWKLSGWQRGYNVFELWFGHPSVLHVVNMLLQPNWCPHCPVGIKRWIFLFLVCVCFFLIVR